MLDFLSSNSLLMLEQAMRFQWTKQTAIQDNIVNAETPGYKAKYVTFEDTLRQRLQTAAQTEAPASAMRSVLAGTVPTVHVADDESGRMDGNGVNVSEQIMELVRNTYQLQYVFRSVNSDMSRIIMAIQG